MTTYNEANVGHARGSTVSHHLLRRRARAKAHALNAIHGATVHYVVERAKRGPYRWRVVKAYSRPRL